MPANKVNKKRKKPNVKKAISKASKKPSKRPKKKITKKVIKRNTQKNTPKKKVTKKLTKKKPIKTERLTLITASNEESFWVNNGPVLNSLPALKNALEVITIEQFEFHTSGSQNDFAIWVETILLDKNCAKELKRAKTQKTAAKKIGNAIKKYKK